MEGHAQEERQNTPDENAAEIAFMQKQVKTLQALRKLFNTKVAWSEARAEAYREISESDAAQAGAFFELQGKLVEGTATEEDGATFLALLDAHAGQKH